MNHPGVSTILATGGNAMVRAAYSCGKPALGVGAGNVPAYIEKTAKLMYELQSNLLTASSDFKDFYMQLGQATINLGYSFDDRLNVREAARAVEIAPTMTPRVSIWRPRRWRMPACARA